jgi:hypothetical protein
VLGPERSFLTRSREYGSSIFISVRSPLSPARTDSHASYRESRADIDMKSEMEKKIPVALRSGRSRKKIVLELSV